ncbi:MAG: hypothetical protein AAF755_10380 [Pseudomonadota bacterium]
MPDIDPIIQAQFAQRRGVIGEVLVWVQARNRQSGQPESIGIWSGDDDQDFVIGGSSRTYFGPAVTKISLVRSVVGLNVVYHTVEIPAFTQEARQLLIQYDAHQAGVEVHVAAFDIDSGALLAAPIRMIKGTLQEAPQNIGERGSRDGDIKLKIASNARKLHLGVPLYKSLEALAQVDPNDRGREYVEVVEDWVVPWGES